MNYLFCYVIEEAVIEGLNKEPSESVSSGDSNSGNQDSIEFIFVESVGSGQTRAINNTISEIKRKLPRKLQRSFDVICFEIHVGDWYESNAEEKKNKTEQFKNEIKQDYGGSSCEIYMKYFSHVPGDNIYEKAVDDPETFLTLEFQKSVFFCTPERLESLLFQFRVYVSTLNAGGCVNKLLPDDRLKETKKHIKEIVEDKGGKFGLLGYEKQCLKPESSSGCCQNAAEPESKVQGFLDKMKQQPDNSGTVPKEFISACSDLEVYMRTKILPKLKY